MASADGRWHRRGTKPTAEQLRAETSRHAPPQNQFPRPANWPWTKCVNWLERYAPIENAPQNRQNKVSLLTASTSIYNAEQATGRKKTKTERPIVHETAKPEEMQVAASLPPTSVPSFSLNPTVNEKSAPTFESITNRDQTTGNHNLDVVQHEKDIVEYN